MRSSLRIAQAPDAQHDGMLAIMQTQKLKDTLAQQQNTEQTARMSRQGSKMKN
jgi:hypothetical protein